MAGMTRLPLTHNPFFASRFKNQAHDVTLFGDRVRPIPHNDSFGLAVGIGQGHMDRYPDPQLQFDPNQGLKHQHSQVETNASCPGRQEEQEHFLRRGLVESVHQRLPFA